MVNASQKTSDIAVIGLSCRFPGSDNADSFWNNLINGKEVIQKVDTSLLGSYSINKELISHPNYISACAFLENIDKFDNEFFKVSSLEAAAMDPQHRIFLEEAYHALEDAGYSSDKYDGKIGIYAGSGPTQYYYELIRNNYFEKHPQSRQLLYYLGNEKDFLALRIAYALNLTGPAININLASATGLAVVVKACQSLVNGEADMMLAGASSVILPNQFGYIYEPENIFSADGHCRPFDKNSTGTVLGSGVGVVVLKRLNDAIEDNDSIYAVLKGYAINNDGSQKIGFTAPSVHGQSSCIKNALKIAQILPNQLKFIEAHGTGTHLGDPIEVSALSEGLNHNHSKQNQFCAIGSVKGNIGHAQSAAGIAGLIKMILAIKNKIIPPSINYVAPNPKINFEMSPFYVNVEAISWDEKIRLGGVNALAMGGVNTHIIVANYDDDEIGEQSKQGYALVPISANREQVLDTIRTNLISYLDKLTDIQLTDPNLFQSLAYTLQVGRKELPVKSAYICRNLDELLQQLKNQPLDEPNDYLNIKNKWLSGEPLDWEIFYKTKPKRISLPNYPFQKPSHWLLEGKAHDFSKIQPIPATKTQHDIKTIIEKIYAIWSKSLKLTDIDLYNDFQSLGGDSLLSIEIITEIERVFNIKITIDNFMSLNSIINLSKYIAHQNQDTTLKPKLKYLTKHDHKKLNLFIIHPGNGEIYFYNELANSLKDTLNLIGISNNVFNDIADSDSVSIPKLAKLYLDLIKNFQPQGPYILGGWSFGGVVAFEMARQLEKKQEIVNQLFLIDSWAKYSHRFSDSDYFFNSYLKNTTHSLPLSKTGLWGKLLWKRMKALFEYKPTVINAQTILLKAASINSEYQEVNAFDNHWQQYCKKLISTVIITGNHETILQLPGLEHLTNTIVSTINKSTTILE